MKSITKDKIKDILINYIFRDMKRSSDREFKITMYFLAILLFTGKKSFYTSIQMLEEGNFPLIGTKNKTKFIEGVGMNRRQILDGIKAINQRGILSVVYESQKKDVIKVGLNKIERSM